MFLPKDVQFILDTFKENSYEAFIVGGCVRDTLLNRALNDYDITTSAMPEDTIRLFDKTIPTGLQHGTITVLLNKEPYEVTTYRVDGEYKDNRRPDEVIFVSNIKEDLARRDFTINALAYSPYFGFKDYFNGKQDLENKIIRCVGDANKRFNEDALRMLRCIRFSAQLNFDIEPLTFNAVKNNAELIKNVSYERINVELIKMLKSNLPSDGAKKLISTDLLKNIYPDLYSNYFNKDYFIENIPYLDKLNNSVTTRLTHFIKSCFKNISLSDFRKALKKLKCDNKTISACTTIFSNSFGYISIDNIVDLKVYLSKIDKPLIKEILAYDKYLAKNTENLISKHNEILEILDKNEPLSIKELNITGSDLITTYNLKAGKILGDILNSLLLDVFKDSSLNLNTTLLNLAKNYIN